MLQFVKLVRTAKNLLLPEVKVKKLVKNFDDTK